MATRATITQEICGYENSIYDLNAQIRSLERRLVSLGIVKDGFIKTQKEFNEFQYEVDRHFVILSHFDVNINFAYVHSQLMLSLVRGSRAQHAEEGLQLGLQKISQDITKTNTRIEELKAKVSQYNTFISNLRYQLGHCDS